ncbi:MAG: UPF0365 family protein [Candidatus Riflebacteria bacterium]|nr:UPF0365 family protein [Candidatus Riflebacteria bacterium]
MDISLILMPLLAVLAAVAGILFIFAIVMVFQFANVVMIYMRSKAADVNISMSDLIGAQLRTAFLPYSDPVGTLVDATTQAQKARINISFDTLETHMMSGGNVNVLVRSLIQASQSGIRLSQGQAAALDLAGHNVLQAVNMSINPKNIRSIGIKGVAKDGIELEVNASITVRANIDSMIGGAGEETVIARINEAVESVIGSAEKHSDILNRPALIAEEVLRAGLDAGSAYEIISIDIADISVLRNIGAMLKNMQAEADRCVSESRAEGRKALAEAIAQENKAAEQEAKAKVLAAEMYVPLSIAAAYKKGSLLVDRDEISGKQEKGRYSYRPAGYAFCDDFDL